MKKYSTINPSPTPPPQEVDVDAVLKSIDSQFELAQNLTKSLDSIKQEISSNAKMINGLLERTNEICEKVKTIDIRVKLSDESKKELDLIHIQYKDWMEKQFADHAKQLDEVLNDYEIKQATMLKASLKMFDSTKGVWLSDKSFWLLFIFLSVLLATTVWFVGQALTN